MKKMISNLRRALTFSAFAAVALAAAAPVNAASSTSHRVTHGGVPQEYAPRDGQHSHDAAPAFRFNFGFGTAAHSGEREHRRHHHHDKLPWPKP